jgi:hypothetical protein
MSRRVRMLTCGGSRRVRPHGNSSEAPRCVFVAAIVDEAHLRHNHPSARAPERMPLLRHHEVRLPSDKLCVPVLNRIFRHPTAACLGSGLARIGGCHPSCPRGARSLTRAEPAEPDRRMTSGVVLCNPLTMQRQVAHRRMSAFHAAVWHRPYTPRGTACSTLMCAKCSVGSLRTRVGVCASPRPHRLAPAHWPQRH